LVHVSEKDQSLAAVKVTAVEWARGWLHVIRKIRRPGSRGCELREEPLAPAAAPPAQDERDPDGGRREDEKD